MYGGGKYCNKNFDGYCVGLYPFADITQWPRESVIQSAI